MATATLPDAGTASRCQATPTATIHDNRLLAVRIIRYNRLDDEAADERIERHTFSTTGSSLDCSDARLADSAQPANFRYQCSLSGRALATASQDAGASQILFDIEGASVWNRDALGNSQRFAHDSLHRLSSVSDNGVSSEQLLYGETAVVAGANRRGQLLQHDDPAGRVSTPAYALTGQPLTEQRQFFSDDGKTLETTVYTSRHGYDALGTRTSLLDAVGNRRRQTLNVAGQLAARDLQWAGSDSWLPLLQSIDYDAAGQVRHEVAGNGVVSDYDYEPQTRRLSTLNTTRPGKPLQALSYQYDPVGNLLGCNDGTVSRRFRRNQAVDGNRSYQYDALYQLVQATGREQAGQQTAALPTPRAIDDTDLSAYTRTYDYDRGGNLSAIHHQATQPYTLAMVVSNTSNRTLQQSDGLTPSDVDAGFDAAGQLRALAAGQPLGWDTRGQLQTVTLLQHDDGSSDQENYRYDGHGQRSQKTLTTRTSGTTRSQRVRYLPGLELRDTLQTPDGGSTSTVETLQLLQLDGSGRLSVRALHWTLGQPADIANDGLRYSLADPVGSSLLELDDSAAVISWETYYPYGGTAAWAARSDSEVSYKFVRYSGKERDASGLYAYGLRYYAPWLGRWINPDPGGTIDGLNLFRMVRNNPVSLRDLTGRMPTPTNFAGFLRGEGPDAAKREAVGRELDKLAVFQTDKGYLAEWQDEYRSVTLSWEEENPAFLPGSMPSEQLGTGPYSDIFVADLHRSPYTLLLHQPQELDPLPVPLLGSNADRQASFEFLVTDPALRSGISQLAHQGHAADLSTLAMQTISIDSGHFPHSTTGASHEIQTWSGAPVSMVSTSVTFHPKDINADILADHVSLTFRRSTHVSYSHKAEDVKYQFGQGLAIRATLAFRHEPAAAAPGRLERMKNLLSPRSRS
ncbi:RHS repeat-associated core domain-containing protein [Microvirgula aerodenitrificans]|uniref:RHS repeat-associated core domain-containing protein n=1 Tax=Microvirgula aerodenitrificans TaxID=57480 RepID=UPI002F3F63D2